MARKQVKRKKLNRKQAERKRAERKQVERQLRQLDAMRQAVQSVDEALQLLTPEERLIVQMLYICPEKKAVQKLCPMLCLEQAAVYRRKNRALKKLAEALRIEN